MQRYFILMIALLNVSYAIASETKKTCETQECRVGCTTEKDEGQCQTWKINEPNYEWYEFFQQKFVRRFGFERYKVPQELVKDATDLAKKLGIKPKEVVVSYFASNSIIFNKSDKYGEFLTEWQFRRISPLSGIITKKNCGSFIALHPHYPIAFQRMSLLTLLDQHDYYNICTRISQGNPQSLCYEPVTKKESDRINRMHPVGIYNDLKCYEEAMRLLDCYKCFNDLVHTYGTVKEQATIQAMSDEKLKSERKKHQQLSYKHEQSIELIPIFEQLKREAQEKKLLCEFHAKYPQNVNYIDALKLDIQEKRKGPGWIRLSNIRPSTNSSSAFSNAANSSSNAASGSPSSSSSTALNTSSLSNNSSCCAINLSSSSASAPVTALALLTAQKFTNK